jgi:hypothetical protein
VEKLVYITRKPEGAARIGIDDLRERLVGDVGKRILDAGVLGLVVQVADLAEDERVQPQQLFGEGASYASLCSVWLDSLDHRTPIEQALASLGGRVDGWLVTESIPQACVDRDWSDGERSPGVTQLVTFPKPDRLSDDAFFAAWHGEHTPFSFELHPTRWSYIRNSVARPVTPGAPPYRAIVEERWRSFEEWLDPEQLFGSPEVMRRTAEELHHYADFESLNQTLLSEYILRSVTP